MRYEDIDRHGKSAKGRKEILKYLDGGRLTQADGRDIMDEERQYIDADGNKRSLFWMVRHEPEWAANVIRSLKNRIAEKDREIGQFMTCVISALTDGKVDCEIRSCPLYIYMPYRKYPDFAPEHRETGGLSKRKSSGRVRIAGQRRKYQKSPVEGLREE